MGPTSRTAPPTEVGAILAIDAAGHSCSVALWRQGGVAAAETRAMSHGQSVELMPMVERIMGEAGLDLRQLERIAVTVGPGGFTGLRIGLATARGLGLAIGCPVVGISSFQSTALAILGTAERPADTDILVALDSRREEPFLARLRADLCFQQQPKLLDRAAIKDLLNDPRLTLISGDGLANIVDLIPPGLRQMPGGSDAKAVAILASDPQRRFDLPPDPQYLRPPDISQPKTIA